MPGCLSCLHCHPNIVNTQYLDTFPVMVSNTQRLSTVSPLTLSLQICWIHPYCQLPVPSLWWCQIPWDCQHPVSWRYHYREVLTVVSSLCLVAFTVMMSRTLSSTSSPLSFSPWWGQMWPWDRQLSAPLRLHFKVVKPVIPCLHFISALVTLYTRVSKIDKETARYCKDWTSSHFFFSQ